jgi:hypothetical protein
MYVTIFLALRNIHSAISRQIIGIYVGFFATCLLDLESDLIIRFYVVFFATYLLDLKSDITYRVSVSFFCDISTRIQKRHSSSGTCVVFFPTLLHDFEKSRRHVEKRKVFKKRHNLAGEYVVFSRHSFSILNAT